MPSPTYPTRQPGTGNVSKSSFDTPASDNARLEGLADGAALVCLFGAVPHTLIGGDIGLAATVITTSVIVVAVRYRIGARALLRLTMPLGQHKPDKTAEEHRPADDLHRNPER